mgnify:CR=1 FL=1
MEVFINLTLENPRVSNQVLTKSLLINSIKNTLPSYSNIHINYKKYIFLSKATLEVDSPLLSFSIEAKGLYPEKINQILMKKFNERIKEKKVIS